MFNKRFIKGEVYHVFNKSIANFNIFNGAHNSYRFNQLLDYYNCVYSKESFSNYLIKNKQYDLKSLLYPKEDRVIKFLAYVIMPDHYHLLIKILNEDKFFKFMNNIGNSYTHYLNEKFKRKGPLWQSAYKSILINNNEQLLHTHRYLHLNPTSSGLVEKPEDWEFSSYKDFIFDEKILNEFVKEISINKPSAYKKFVEDNKDYQRNLKLIKKLLLE